MIAAIGNGLLVSAGSGPQVPTINDFLPPQIVFAGTPFALNRIILVRIVATLVILIGLGLTAQRAKLIPGRWQGVVEWMLEFVRDTIVYEVMGEVRGRRYVPMITTLFLSIFVFNICGVIPGLNIAATATITMPLLFAMWTFCQYWIAAAREKGLGRFLRDELFPPGVPWPVYILLAPIQLFELLVIRPFSLTIRLFANMIAGHLLVAVCLVFGQFYLIEATNKLMMPLGGMWILGGFAFTAFEIIVAALQAFIFAILSAVYINQSYPETA